MKRLYGIILFPMFFAQDAIAVEKVAILHAPTGHYDRADLSEPRSEGTVKALINFTEYRHGSGWPPTANIGFYQGNNRDNSIQFMVMHRVEGDENLGVGYRYLVHGKVVKVATFIDTRVSDGVVEFLINYKNGRFSVCINGTPMGDVFTELVTVTPFISVASGVAQFETDT